MRWEGKEASKKSKNVQGSNFSHFVAFLVVDVVFGDVV